MKIAENIAGSQGRGLNWLVMALVAGMALTLVACGGGSGDDASEADAPSMGHTSAGSAQGGGNAVVGPAGRGDDGAFSSGGASEEAADMDAGAPSDGVPRGEAGVTSLPSTLGRTIIRNGSVELEVESVSQSFERVRQVAEGAGGFVAESTFSGFEEHQSASLTLRIPADRFGDVVAQLQDLAVEVHTVSSSSTDVTEEYTDLQSSLRNLQAVEQQYLTLLGQAEDIEDVLVVQDRLNNVRGQIEQVQGRLNLLDNLSSMATIRVSLFPEQGAAALATASEPGFGERVAEAWESSLDAIETVATGVAVALVWSWWLLPVVAIVAWLARRYAVRYSARAAAARRVDTPEGAA